MEALRLYRQLLRQVQYLPPDARASALQRTRVAFRANKDVSDGMRIRQLLLEGRDKLSYLKMSTARTRVDMNHTPSVKQGRAIPQQAYKDYSVPDPDDLRRHHSLLRRQYFME
eukprot:TRINITY_DN6573_c0_g1_i1.p1 TRINITY_DN6573_c0_g1~~TRINITY_DN6573_c0_g1_i1.p1  ORF type:complete len:113 (-),score=8.40 TRINITY_DN6573_c0_g1_i1:77-415(-)